jgi:hypothetical protein
MHGAHMGRARRAQVFAGCRRLSDVAPEPLGVGQPIVQDIAVATAGAGPRDAVCGRVAILGAESGRGRAPGMGLGFGQSVVEGPRQRRR